jgi:hypothetical protein
MKKISTPRLRYTAFFVSILIVFYSCKKSSDDGNTTPAPVSSFTWTYNGNTYIASLDTAYQFSIPLSPYSIIAINGTNFSTSFTRKILFKLSSFNIGAFTISSGGNSLRYVDDGGNDLFGTSGTLNITANASNRLTGNFSCTMTGSPGTFTVTGQFANVSIRP